MSNVPTVFRRVVDGFIIKPRSFTQLLSSAMMGGFSLIGEESRKVFSGYLDKGIINEGVMSQASSGAFMMLSLHHDLQSPLFQKFHFEPHKFLEGVAPSLENFHNISGALENEFHSIEAGRTEEKAAEEKETKVEEGKTLAEEGMKGDTSMDSEEKESIFRMATSESALQHSKLTKDRVTAVLDHDWEEEASKNPDSLAAQLSRMISKELFQMHQLSLKTAFLLQNHNRSISFEEGSCTVNNVALLSARAFLQVNGDADDDKATKRFEEVDYNIPPEEIEDDVTVAAQVEVLYDITHSFKRPAAKEGGASDEIDQLSISTDDPESDRITSTVVSVATIEGFLNGGPDGELRWRLALHRPAYEFPGINQAY